MTALNAPVADAGPLYPPGFDPPARLSLAKFAAAMVRNPLQAVPEAAYHEPLVQFGRRFT